ncbi:MAG: ComF family protein [Desulfobacter sp.]
MFAFLKSVNRALAAMVFPDKCLKCGVYLTPDRKTTLSACWCPGCMGQSLPFFYPPFCTCCGHLFEARTGENHMCENCLASPPATGMVRAAFAYRDVVREGIGLFKYQSRLSLAKPFESCLFEAFDTYFSEQRIDLILPVPLHREKAGKRGFNQAYLLVRNFRSLYRKKYGKNPPWKVEINGLVRVKSTPSQTGLDIREREKNLKQAFEWQERIPLKGTSVLLVDDVYTTGATCNAAAKTLLDAGAVRVDALVLTRA